MKNKKNKSEKNPNFDEKTKNNEENKSTNEKKDDSLHHHEYLKNVWMLTLKKAELQENEIYSNYMNSIIKIIENEKKNSQRNKKQWKKTEYAIIICSAGLIMLNTFAATIDKAAFLINIFAAIVAAMLSIINGIKTNREYKETWLRHSIYISKLYMECQYFATRSGEYKRLKDECKDDSDGLNEEKCAKLLIEEFQARTTEIMQENYDTFFSNMNKQ